MNKPLNKTEALLYVFCYCLHIGLFHSYTGIKKTKRKKNTKSLESSKEFLCENENIIKYNFYSDSIIYTVLMLVIFAIYGLMSLIFPTLLSKYSFFNIFTYIIFLIFIIISIILSIKIRFSGILIISNKSIMHISGNKLRKKIYINEIKKIYSAKYFSLFFLNVLILKNFKIKIIEGFSDIKDIKNNIQQIVRKEAMEK